MVNRRYDICAQGLQNMTSIDPDAYIRSSIDAGRSMREIARDIGCDRMGVYRRIRAMGLHGRQPVLEPHEERAVETLVDQIGRPNNPLHAIVIRTVAETVLAAKCGSPEETEKTVITVADALNRLLRNPDVLVTMKKSS